MCFQGLVREVDYVCEVMTIRGMGSLLGKQGIDILNMLPNRFKEMIT